jgi:hypothetical protein
VGLIMNLWVAELSDMETWSPFSASFRKSARSLREPQFLGVNVQEAPRPDLDAEPLRESAARGAAEFEFDFLDPLVRNEAVTLSGRRIFSRSCLKGLLWSRMKAR